MASAVTAALDLVAYQALLPLTGSCFLARRMLEEFAHCAFCEMYWARHRRL